MILQYSLVFYYFRILEIIYNANGTLDLVNMINTPLILILLSIQY